MCDVVPTPVLGHAAKGVSANLVRVIEALTGLQRAWGVHEVMPYPGEEVVYLDAWRSDTTIYCRHPDTDWERLERPPEGKTIALPPGTEIRWDAPGEIRMSM